MHTRPQRSEQLLACSWLEDPLLRRSQATVCTVRRQSFLVACSSKVCGPVQVSFSPCSATLCRHLPVSFLFSFFGNSLQTCAGVFCFSLLLVQSTDYSRCPSLSLLSCTVQGLVQVSFAPSFYCTVWGLVQVGIFSFFVS